MVALELLPADQVRFLDVQALVGTGTNFIGLAASDVARLGLRPVLWSAWGRDWRADAICPACQDRAF